VKTEILQKRIIKAFSATRVFPEYKIGCYNVHMLNIFHDICYKLEKKLFSHTLTVTLLSTPATMLQLSCNCFFSIHG